MTGNFLTYRQNLWLKITLLSTALLGASYVLYSARTEPNGGTVMGLVYGGLGLFVILLLMFYGVRKRQYRAQRTSLQAWLSSHAYLGLLTLILIPMHAGFRFGLNVHTLAFVLLAFVVLSGLVGTYFYVALPSRFSHHGPEVTYAGIDREFQKIVNQMRGLCQDKSDTFVRTCELEIQRGAPTPHAGWHLLLHHRPVSAAHHLQELQTSIAELPETEHDDFQRLAVLATQKRELEHRLVSQMRLKNLLEAWLYVHLPVSIAMLVAVGIHLVVVLYY